MSKLNTITLDRLAQMSNAFDAAIFHKIPVDLEAIGASWGVQTVIKRELDVAGLLYRLDNGRTVVFLNERDSGGRQRFSWAHELGHIVMADQMVPQVSCRQGKMIDKNLERSCDVIATELLMPREVFHQVAERIGWTLNAVRELSRRFQVTVQAAALRLLELSNVPLMMSVWQSRKDPLLGLRSKWSRPNDAGRSMRPSIIWKSAPEAIQPLYAAFQESGVVSGTCHILLTKNKVRNFRSVPTDAIGVGSGNNRTVIGFHHLNQIAS